MTKNSFHPKLQHSSDEIHTENEHPSHQTQDPLHRSFCSGARSYPTSYHQITTHHTHRHSPLSNTDVLASQAHITDIYLPHLPSSSPPIPSFVLTEVSLNISSTVTHDLIQSIPLPLSHLNFPQASRWILQMSFLLNLSA